MHMKNKLLLVLVLVVAVFCFSGVAKAFTNAEDKIIKGLQNQITAIQEQINKINARLTALESKTVNLPSTSTSTSTSTPTSTDASTVIINCKTLATNITNFVNANGTVSLTNSKYRKDYDPNNDNVISAGDVLTVNNAINFSDTAKCSSFLSNVSSNSAGTNSATDTTSVIARCKTLGNAILSFVNTNSVVTSSSIKYRRDYDLNSDNVISAADVLLVVNAANSSNVEKCNSYLSGSTSFVDSENQIASIADAIAKLAEQMGIKLK